MKFFGRQNEIKELEQKVIFYEVKRQAKDINLGILKIKPSISFRQQENSRNSISCTRACRWRTCKIVWY